MAVDFTTQPVLVLDKDETLALLATGTELPHKGTLDLYRIKSQWLCDLLDEREQVNGYQYNTEFQRWLESEYGLPAFNENGSSLSILIYNAQGFRRNDKLRREGWIVGCDEVLASAFANKQKVKTTSGTLLTVREINGKLYAMKPNARKYAVSIGGYPVQLVRK